MANTIPDQPNFALLYDLLNAPIGWSLLSAAIELKVFGQLEHPKTANQLAQELGAHPGNTAVLLDGLTACGLLSKKDGQYQNNRVAQAYLVPGNPTDLSEMLQSLAFLRHAGLDDLVNLVRQGPKAAGNGPDLNKQESWSRVTSYLANYHRAGIAQEALNIIAALPEYSNLKKMLDLGGGPGLIGMAVVQAHPALKGVLFDLPKVVPSAQAHIEELGLESRMEILSGDYNQDPIGDEYDLVWASLNLYYARDKLNRLLAKIHASLNPGGVFVSYHEGLTHERTEPREHVVGRIALSFKGHDMSFDQGHIARSLLEAGFRSVHSRTIQTSNGPIDVDIARK